MISKINKEELIKIVTNNRATHKSVFEEAWTEYERQVIATMETNLADAKAGRGLRTSINMVMPTNQTEDYDRVLRMLDLHQGDDIELDEHEFDNYVMDNWEWSQRWSASNMLYTSRVRR